jgi:hypothetical protein
MRSRIGIMLVIEMSGSNFQMRSRTAAMTAEASPRVRISRSPSELTACRPGT